MNDLTVLRRALQAGRTAGFALSLQPGYHTPAAGILRWRAARPGVGSVVIEHWTLRRLPEQRWYARIAAPGLIVEFTEGVIVRKVVDACVVAGILPMTSASTYSAGVTAAADAVEAHAESIGWYEDGGVWADAIEHARQAAQ